ncbi:ATP-binding protein [Streptomyces xinghaiensis]|uniref:ATP-binding protein n=1 Tax=Streptomyces xinghaiensis TaxID=1038928 RepID=UPI002E120E47|nr:ATP-binding protein [Streptomyces xinghaiensis]
MGGTHCMARKSWELDFRAAPEEVIGLRRVMRLHLGMWGLPELVDVAQLCVSELVTNVIRHVGIGTPTGLTVSMRDTNLRLAVHDPDSRSLPVQRPADTEAESGRGLSLIAALAEAWGVEPGPSGKTTWCELATGLTTPTGHGGGRRVDRAEAVLVLYGTERVAAADDSPILAARVAEESAIGLIADLLHWFRAHGRDAEEALDRAQTHYEAQLAAWIPA